MRDGLKARLGDPSTALFALTVAAVFDPLDCRFNLVEGVVLAPQQTQREFPIKVVTAKRNRSRLGEE